MAVLEDQRPLVVGDHVERTRLAAFAFVQHEMPQHAAEGLFQVRLREDLDRRSIGEHGAVQQHGAIAEFRHAAEIVRRDQHHTSLVAKRAQQLDDGVFGLDVDTGEGFVEQDHSTVLGERAGEEDALLLAAGEFADLALAEIGHADALKRRCDGFMIRGFGDAHHVHVAIAAHHHDVLDENGEVPVDVLALRHIGDEVLLQRGIDRLAENRDLAPGEADEAHDRLEQGGFAAAVDADERGDRACRDLERRIAQGGVTVAVGDGRVSDGESGSRIRGRGIEERIDHRAHCARPFAIVSDVTRRRSI